MFIILAPKVVFVYNTAQEQVVLIVKARNSEYPDIPLDLNILKFQGIKLRMY
jgi:hypothetical protein